MRKVTLFVVNTSLGDLNVVRDERENVWYCLKDLKRLMELKYWKAGFTEKFMGKKFVRKREMLEMKAEMLELERDSIVVALSALLRADCLMLSDVLKQDGKKAEPYDDMSVSYGDRFKDVMQKLAKAKFKGNFAAAHSYIYKKYSDKYAKGVKVDRKYIFTHPDLVERAIGLVKSELGKKG